MKKLMCLCLVALSLLACKNDEVNTITCNPYDNSITGTYVSVDAAPNWQLCGNRGYSSMSMIVDEYTIPCSVQEGDLIAAFIGTTCRGVVKPFKDGSNKWRFNLPVVSCTTDEGTLQVEIRYYSTKHSGIYTSSTPITYSDNAILGSVIEGYPLRWK